MRSSCTFSDDACLSQGLHGGRTLQVGSELSILAPLKNILSTKATTISGAAHTPDDSHLLGI